MRWTENDVERMVDEGNRALGLEVQLPWSDKLVKGIKTIETRGYALPENILNVPILVLQAQEGTALQTSIPDVIEGDETLLQIVGVVYFTQNIAYETYEAWMKDIPLHRVGEDSPYAWTEKNPVFGWKVENPLVFEKPIPVYRARRWFRSFFSVNH